MESKVSIREIISYYNLLDKLGIDSGRKIDELIMELTSDKIADIGKEVDKWKQKENELYDFKINVEDAIVIFERIENIYKEVKDIGDTIDVLKLMCLEKESWEESQEDDFFPPFEDEDPPF